MRTVKFEVQIDINVDKDLTPDDLLEFATNIDRGIRRERNEWGIIPTGIMRGFGKEEVEAKLIRVKPL